MHVLTRECSFFLPIVVDSDFDITPTPLYVTRGSASSNERGDLGATLGEGPPGRSGGVEEAEAKARRSGAIREYQIEKSNLRGRETAGDDDEVDRGATKKGRTSAISVTHAGGLDVS